MDKPGAAGRVYIIDSVVDASKIKALESLMLIQAIWSRWTFMGRGRGGYMQIAEAAVLKQKKVRPNLALAPPEDRSSA